MCKCMTYLPNVITEVSFYKQEIILVSWACFVSTKCQIHLFIHTTPGAKKTVKFLYWDKSVCEISG